MRRPTFLSATGFALLMAAAAGCGYAVLAPVLAPAATLELLISGLGLLYLLWLLRAAERRAGRVTALAAWLLLSGIAWFLAPSVLTSLFLHAALLWLVRSLVRYRSALPALLDLGASVVAIGAAAWAARQTGSVFMTAWSFFLVQAVALAIPARIPRRARRIDHGPDGNGAFEQAKRRAESAFRQLIARAGQGSPVNE